MYVVDTRKNTRASSMTEMIKMSYVFDVEFMIVQLLYFGREIKVRQKSTIANLELNIVAEILKGFKLFSLVAGKV